MGEPAGHKANEPALLCMECGYNLRGLPADGNCPECGTLIRHSRRNADLLYADVDWLASIVRGQQFILAGAAIGLVLIPFTVGALFAEGVGAVIGLLLIQISPMLILFGTFHLTMREPNVYERPRATLIRRLARIALALASILLLIPFVLFLSGVWIDWIDLLFAVGLGALMTYAACILHVYHALSRRAGHNRLRRAAAVLCLLVMLIAIPLVVSTPFIDDVLMTRRGPGGFIMQLILTGGCTSCFVLLVAAMLGTDLGFDFLRLMRASRDAARYRKDKEAAVASTTPSDHTRRQMNRS